MAFKTLSEIKTKIERDLDIEEEEFIQPDELTEYINDGISRAESIIEKLGGRDKYFLSKLTFDAVLGQEDYDLPVNIYENKLKKVIYRNGRARVYPIRELVGVYMYEDIQLLNDYQTTDDNYRYIIRHDVPGQEKFQLIPATRENVVGGITMWFIREANKLSVDADICDLPEIAMQFLYQYVKKCVYEKEKGQEWQIASEELKEVTQVMIEGLTGQIADEDRSEIEKDLRTYEEHS